MQITYGIIYKNDCPIKSRNIYLGLNIGIGIAAIISSGLRLLKKEDSKPISLNHFIQPRKIFNPSQNNIENLPGF